MSHAAAIPADHSAAHPHGHDHAHGGGDHAHKHVIVPRRVLLSILGILLFFTLATVGAAQLEQFIAHQFNIVIPQWVNVAVALSIAAVKTFFVMAYFMQLRYDNPVNTLIMVFTFFTLCFFLGFTMIDLGARSAIYGYKAQYIVDGGSGNLLIGKDDSGKDVVIPANTSIAAFARVRAAEDLDRLLIKERAPLPKVLVVFAAQETDRLIAAKVPKESWSKAILEFQKVRTDPRYEAMLASAHGHGGHDDHAPISANRGGAPKGITDPQFGGKADGHGAHDAHGGKPDAGHGAPAEMKPAETKPADAKPGH